MQQSSSVAPPSGGEDYDNDQPEDGVVAGPQEVFDEGEDSSDDCPQYYSGSDDSDSDTDVEDSANLEDEHAWERPPPAECEATPVNVDQAPAEDPIDPEYTRLHREEEWRRRRVRDALQAATYVVPYPSGASQAGEPIQLSREPTSYHTARNGLQQDGDDKTNLYAPFVSFIDYAVAMWAKMRGPGSTAVTELLEIDGLVSQLGLSYKNSRELNKLIDNQLSSTRPRFKRQEFLIGGEVFELFYRDVIECIQALYGDPEFSGVLVFTPERHYTDADRKIRVYFDIHTGKWWWATQEALDRVKPGGTIIPVIISSDKTQLTVFGNKTAYPVYLTIGNLPKHIRRKPSRRGQILLAYLPTTKLEHITTKAARRRAQNNLYHACMGHVLKPLEKAGVHGVNMTGGDGIVRRGHPIVAIHAEDYPEQLLTTCCMNGDCPRCSIDRDDVGATTDPSRPLRDLNAVMDALAVADTGTSTEFVPPPVRRPYWLNLPFHNVFRSITPDVLHQLHQGVVKHLISWLKIAFGEDEIDARCRRIPPNHQIRVFMKGISGLQRVTGKEHAAISRFLLGLVIGHPLRGGFSPIRLVRAVRAILDFLYLAQYPAHTSDTLELLKDALRRFHENKSIFIILAIREHFKIPKLHFLDHYFELILLFGTTDNYDTQLFERLHIDLAKEAWRATNHKDEFVQMTLWLERREKMQRHAAFVAWRLNVEDTVPHDLRSPSPSSDPPSSPGPRVGRQGPQPSGRSVSTSSKIFLTKWPSVRRVPISSCAQLYQAEFLPDALARFVVSFRYPDLTNAEVESQSSAVHLPFNAVPVYHKIKFILPSPQKMGIPEGDVHDTVHARPERKDARGRLVPARFDTVLVKEDENAQGIHKYRVGRVRLIFSIPKAANQVLFPRLVPPQHLAYIEWFTAFRDKDPDHGLYRVRRCRNRAGDRLASVIPVADIHRSCHLFPVFGGSVAPRDWTSSTVLDRCDIFYVNIFSDQHMYMTAL
ncbi:uncharacterized protein BXZ73DRAFT_93522 [Epithele typhae]|uniref:uncharacterized protein n=1 Tax=Epithele typhae TaxID=378194 RepID=UPI002007D25E|nr:uncharacterized protein BXZ73DRAFT_93522 [Epithele typhae]KAH9910875.1 hypothetical protein BXZ73DRAFT_93522 [Epithele typhae]